MASERVPGADTPPPAAPRVAAREPRAGPRQRKETQAARSESPALGTSARRDGVAECGANPRQSGDPAWKRRARARAAGAPGGWRGRDPGGGGGHSLCGPRSPERAERRAAEEGGRSRQGGLRAPEVASPGGAPTSHPRPAAGRGSAARSVGQLTRRLRSREGPLPACPAAGAAAGAGAARRGDGALGGARPAGPGVLPAVGFRAGRGRPRLSPRRISISLPRPRFGAARARPDLLGGARRRGTADAGFRLLARDSGRAWGAEQPEVGASRRCGRPRS